MSFLQRKSSKKHLFKGLNDLLIYLEQKVPIEEKYQPIREEFKQFRKLKEHEQVKHFVGLFLFVERSLQTHSQDKRSLSLRQDLIARFPMVQDWKTFQPITESSQSRSIVLLAALIVESVEEEVNRIYGRGKAAFFSGLTDWVEKARNKREGATVENAENYLKEIYSNTLNVLGKSAGDKLFNKGFEGVFKCYRDWEYFEQIIELLPANFLSEAHFRTFTNAQLHRLLSDNIRQQQDTNEALKKEMVAREEVAKDLTETKGKLQKILDSTLDAVITASMEGTISFWNKKAEELFGYTVKEALGQDLSELIIPERHRLAHISGMNRMGINPPDTFSRLIETDALTKSGAEIQISISLVMVTEGSEIQFNAFIRDISSRAMLKQLQKEKLEAKHESDLKDQFMAKMSHELRTPLNGISGFTQLLSREDGLSEDHRAMVANIHSSSQQLEKLVDELLDLTRIEQGKIVLKPKETEFRTSIHKALEQHRIEAEAKGVAFELELDKQIPIMLNFDGGRYLQVLNNLVSNALKFTNEGKISVYIYVTLRMDKEIRLCTWVRDSGMGIADGAKGQIFDPFYTYSPESSAFSGTGLGLAISQELVKMMGGQLIFASPGSLDQQDGKGSDFAFTIAAALTSQKANSETALPSSTKKKNLLQNKRVMIVEDNRISQMVARKAVESFGGIAICVFSAEEGLSHLKSESQDLIIMDINLPEMNGWEATREIREGLNLSTPVVALSANAYPDDIKKSLDHGMYAHLAKPINMNELETLFLDLFHPKFNER